MSLDTRILAALRECASISGTELSDRIGATTAEMRARIEALQALGYDIEASPHSGYRLLRSPDRLHAEDLAARLGPVRIVGRDIRVFQETASTNDIVERLAADGVAEGTVVFAEAQTRGRGRLGRRWLSPAGSGLWFSVLLRPALPPDAVTQLNVAAAVAVARAIQSATGLQSQIKWPNDLLLRGRKLAGLLTELSAELDRVRHVVLGIGLNVNLDPESLPSELRGLATSLSAETGRPVDRPALAAAVLRELDHDYARVIDGQFEAVANEWEAQCVTVGQDVVVHQGGRRLAGRAESLDAAGALLVRTQHGHLERVIGGDVERA